MTDFIAKIQSKDNSETSKVNVIIVVSVDMLSRNQILHSSSAAIRNLTPRTAGWRKLSRQKPTMNDSYGQ